MGLAAAFTIGACAEASAQDINGVPNADVRVGYMAASYRVGYSPQGDGRPSTLAQQASFQSNFGDRWAFAAAANFGKRGDGPNEFRAFQSILQWQFAESEQAGADGSVLVIARYPDKGNGPGRVAVVLAGKRIFDDVWEVRGGLSVSVEYGEDRNAGAGFGGRIEATRRFGTFGRLGVQTGHGFNTTAHVGSFNEQNHQAGVVAKTMIGHSLAVTATSLFGVSRAAPDAEFKLFLTYEL